MALALGTIVYQAGVRNALATALLAAIDAGTAAIIELYTSNGGTLLATITYAATSFSVSGAVLTCLGVPLTQNAVASGVPTYYKVLTQSAGTFLFDGTVTGGDTINSGQPVNLTAMTITIGA
jgi:hypothetical protein